MSKAKRLPKAPLKYNCPLMHEWPVDPVLGPDGKVYERRMLLAEVFKNGGFFYGKLFHVGLLQECPERLEVMKNLPKTTNKIVWEKNSAAYRKRFGLVQPFVSKPKKETDAPKKPISLLKEVIDTYLENGEVAEAREFFTSARPNGVDEEKEYVLVTVSARIYVAEGKYDEAIIEYKKIIEKWKLNIFYEIAEVYAKQEDHVESVKWHKKGVKVPQVHNKRANCEKLAEAYNLGRGVEKNEEKFLYWTREAAARSTKEGEGEPFIDLAEHYVDKKQILDALKNYDSAAKLRDIEAMTLMDEVDEFLTSKVKNKRQRKA